jgi:hypothetical protein
VRSAARAAFLAHGDTALEFLDHSLGDYHLPQELRRHLPRTLSQFPAAQAAPLLLRHLVSEPDGMVRFKILRGVGRIRASNPALPLDGRIIDEAVHATERLFRMLQLQFPREDVRGIYRGFQSGSAKLRASSRELLENLLRPPLRDAVLALVDGVPTAGAFQGTAPYYLGQAVEYEELLGLMLEEGSESLRCLAAHHVAELGLVSLRPRLEALRPVEKGFFVSRVLERALALLAPAAEPGLSGA